MIARFLFMLCMFGVAASLVLAVLTQFYFFEISFLYIIGIGAVVLALPFLPPLFTRPKALRYFNTLSHSPMWLQGLVALSNLGMILALGIGFITRGLVFAAVPFLFVAAIYATNSVLYYSQPHRRKYDIDRLRTR